MSESLERPRRLSIRPARVFSERPNMFEMVMIAVVVLGYAGLIVGSCFHQRLP